MPYKQAKVYFDGSHYIAIPKENFPRHKSRKKQTQPIVPDSPKAKFEAAYKESQSKPKKERKQFIKNALRDSFSDKEETAAFVERHCQRKKNNSLKRKSRLIRKVNLQEWNYFCTFTYFYEHFLELRLISLFGFKR